MTGEMGIEYARLAIVINRLRRNELPSEAESLKAATGADDLIGLPNDDTLMEYSESGANLLSVSPKNPVLARLDRFVNHVVTTTGTRTVAGLAHIH